MVTKTEFAKSAFGLPNRVRNGAPGAQTLLGTPVPMLTVTPWMMSAAKTLALGGDVLWQIFCEDWASSCLTKMEANKIVEPILEALIPK
jgi:hypothetical protein